MNFCVQFCQNIHFRFCLLSLATQKNVNGQVVRTIGETAVGSIDLIRSVDSKFEIVRSVEKVLKEAVSNAKANNVGTGTGTGTSIQENPDIGKVSSGKVNSKDINKSSVDIKANKSRK